MEISLDNDTQVETVVLLSKLKSTQHIEVEPDLTDAEKKAGC